MLWILVLHKYVLKNHYDSCILPTEKNSHVVSTGHVPQSAPLLFYLPQMCSGSHPRGPRSPLGPNSPMLLENLAQSVAKNVVLSKMSQANCPQAAGRHFQSLVSWALTTVSTDYSQEDAEATVFPWQRELPVFIHHFPKGTGKQTLGHGSLRNALFQKEIQPLWKSGFREQVQDVKEAVMCYFQRAKSEGLCWAATICMSRESFYEIPKCWPTKSSHIRVYF